MRTHKTAHKVRLRTEKNLQLVFQCVRKKAVGPQTPSQPEEMSTQLVGSWLQFVLY